MSVELNNLQPKKGHINKRKRIGRGGKTGTYSGKGMKGQRSRSGGSGGLKLRGFKAQLQRLPKLRGFKSRRPRPITLNLKDLETRFNSGDEVNITTIFEKGLISKNQLKLKLKILGEGELTKKLTVAANAFSANAKKAIEDAGGETKEIKQ